MSVFITVDEFQPSAIQSGDTIHVWLTYSAEQDGFIVVNEGPQFDAVPGRIPVKKGENRTKTASIKIFRQPGGVAKECLISFTLHPASHQILVRVK